MRGRGLFGLVVLALMVLLIIWVYNAFIAKPGESIATLGMKKAAAILIVLGTGLLVKLDVLMHAALPVLM